MNEGWALPLHAYKWHYFDEDSRVSLCRGWAFPIGRRQPDDGIQTPHDCKKCRTKLEAKSQAGRLESAR